jgi:hypothetical protein
VRQTGKNQGQKGEKDRSEVGIVEIDEEKKGIGIGEEVFQVGMDEDRGENPEIFLMPHNQIPGGLPEVPIERIPPVKI